MEDIILHLQEHSIITERKFLEVGMRVMLEKEPDNEYDKEAIQVKVEGLGCIGYVANSPRTVVGESYSAGRLYDKIGDRAFGKVLYVMPTGVLCKLSKKSLVTEELEDIQIQIQEDINE